jgi:hypothetical protein
VSATSAASRAIGEITQSPSRQPCTLAIAGGERARHSFHLAAARFSRDVD